METRANYVWVGAVSLVLLALLALFIVWLAQLGNADRKEYDIFFEQSVGGLAKGSEVDLQGRPRRAGQGHRAVAAGSRVRPRARLARRGHPDPAGHHRLDLGQLHRRFDGLARRRACAARRRSPSRGPEGVPVIPAEPGGLGEILASAPLLLERLATLTDRLTRLLSDENQASISGILANTDRMSAQMADMGPEFRAALVELKGTLAQSTETLDAFEGTLRSTDSLLNNEGQSLAREMRTTMQSAQQAATALEATLQDARPGRARAGAKPRCRSPMPRCRTCKRTSAALRAVTERIESRRRRLAGRRHQAARLRAMRECIGMLKQSAASRDPGPAAGRLLSLGGKIRPSSC